MNLFRQLGPIELAIICCCSIVPLTAATIGLVVFLIQRGKKKEADSKLK